MKKIAILSDIHGNSVALAAVLEHIRRQEICIVLILGDFIGYYHRPQEVMEMLEASRLDITAVCGNHEQMLEAAMQNGELWSTIAGKYGHGLWIAKERLSKAAMGKLLNLPSVREFTIGNRSVIMSHGFPMDNVKYIYPDSQLEKYDLSHLKADIVIMGHTHYPMVGFTQGKLLINPGSVGQSRRYGGIAEWAVFYMDTGMVVPQCTPYDVQPVMKDCYKYDKNVPYLVEVLQRGKAICR